jgi:hypothetical protein
MLISTGFELYQEQNQGRLVLTTLASLERDDFYEISSRDSLIKQAKKLDGIPDKLLKDFLASIPHSDSARFSRPQSDSKKIFLRFKTSKGNFDMEFYYHSQLGKPIQFVVIERDYFASDSYTQKNFGSFRSGYIHEFLRYVDQS